MIRSIEFPCDPRWIKNPTNNPIATIGQRMAAAARTKKAIAAMQAILSAQFTPPPLSQAPRGSNDTAGLTRPNHWTVRLTRISNGTLDPLTSGSSMKAIQDAIARWCGVADERNPIWTWVEPIGQEKRGQGVYGVRIEIESLEPGVDRIVRLKFPEPKRREGKRGRPTPLDLRNAAERAFARPRASDGCHERPETVMVLDQLGRSPDPIPSTRKENRKPPAGDPGEERAACMLAPCPRCWAPAGEPCRHSDHFSRSARKYGVHVERAKAAGITGVHVPGAPATAILCAGCGAKAMCWGNYEGSTVEHGRCDRCCPHEQKGRACKPLRKLATVKARECWVRRPWAKACGECEGSGTAEVGEEGTGAHARPCVVCAGGGRALVRWTAADAKDLPETAMPLEAKRHAWGEVCGVCAGEGLVIRDAPRGPETCAACLGHGRVLRMIRRPWRRAGEVAECWLYEPA